MRKTKPAVTPPCPWKPSELLHLYREKTLAQIGEMANVSAAIAGVWVRKCGMKTPSGYRELLPATSVTSIATISPSQLRASRLANKIPMRSMAKRLGLHNHDTIRLWENGTQKISSDYLLRWMLICGVDAVYLREDKKIPRDTFKQPFSKTFW